MSTKGTNRHLLGSLQDVIDAGLEYSLVEQDAEQYLHLLFDLQGDYLVDLQTLVGDSPQVPVDMMKIVYYYRFKVSEFIALHYDRLFLTDRLQAEISPEVRIRVTGRYQDLAIQSYESSKQIWMNMTQQYQYFGTGNHIMNSYQEILLIVKKILHLHCVPSISGRGRDVSLQVLKKLRNEVIKFSLLDAWQMLHLSTETLWKQKKMKSFAQYLSQLEVMAASNDDKDSRGVLPKETIGSMIESVLLMMQCYVMIHVEEPAASSKALLEVIEDLKWLMCTLLHENMNSAEFARCMEKGIPLVHVQDLYPHVGIFTRHLVDLSATSANINKTQEAALNHKKLLLVKGLIIKAMTMKSANEFEASQSEQSKTAKLASNSFPQETKPSNENVKKMKKVKRKDK